MHKVSHTKTKSNESHAPHRCNAPPRSNILAPSPLWRQAPKPKGRTAGQEQMSRALRRGQRSGTMSHHPLTLSSEQSDPLSLEVKVKRSGSARELAWPVTLEVSL